MCRLMHGGSMLASRRAAGGEAGYDISGGSGSLHLVFSRLWFNKYELIH